MSEYLVCDLCNKLGGSLYDDGDVCLCGGQLRDIFFYKADRDRWKARCEAAEGYIWSIADGGYFNEGSVKWQTKTFTVNDEYEKWQKIKSEMEVAL